MIACTKPQRTTITHADWLDKGKRLFGSNVKKWRFICPCCQHIATVQDWIDAKAEQGQVARSCVGRNLDASDPVGVYLIFKAYNYSCVNAPDQNTYQKAGGPCTYAGGGLFGLNPVTVQYPDGKYTEVFDFAPPATEEVPT